jgi:hypothetical protein
MLLLQLAVLEINHPEAIALRESLVSEGRFLLD